MLVKTKSSPDFHSKITYIPEKDVTTKPERSRGINRPAWRLDAGRVVMRSAASGVGYLSVDHLASGNTRLRQLAERDLFHTDQELIVGVVLVPATELVRLLAHAGVAFAPPRFGLAVVHTVADRPDHGNLASQCFTARLTP